MLSIHLKNLIFKAYHGIYEEEKIQGNIFEVNIAIYHHPHHTIEAIEQTINYELVYELVNKRMQIATPLLETVVMDIAHLILQQFVLAEKVIVSVTKTNPPIKNFIGNVEVSFELKR